MTDTAYIERDSVHLNAQQMRALCKLTRNGRVGVELEQTWSYSGGTHLYARSSGQHFHISVRGTVMELEA